MIPFGKDKNHLMRRYRFLLRWFANTDAGKLYLSGQGIILPKQPIVYVLPNGYISFIDRVKNQIILHMEVTPDNNIYKKLYKSLLTLEYYQPYLASFSETQDLFLATISSSNRVSDIGQHIHFNTISPTPDATHRDGRCGRETSNESWASKRGGAGQQADATTDGPQIVASADAGNPWAGMYRRPCPADTSALTTKATLLTTSSIRPYISGVVQTLAGQAMRVVTTTAPGSLTGVANGDYNLANWASTTAQTASDLTLAGMATTAYNTMTFNATGLSNISKTGVSYFGFRLACDCDNAEPSWSSGVIARVQIQVYSQANPTIYSLDYSLPGGLLMSEI